MTGKPAAKASGSAPLKRSLFNKPSWSKPQKLANEADLFHRSNQNYVGLAAEADHERKKKLARKQRERARRDGNEERTGKRRRISEDEDDKDAEDNHSSSDESSNHSEDEKTKGSTSLPKPEHTIGPAIPKKPKKPPKSLLKRYEATVDASKRDSEQKRKTQLSNIIDLEDDEDFSLLSSKGTARNIAAIKTLRPEEGDQPASDEEFPELARQARERARRKRLEEDLASTTATPDSLLTAGKDDSWQRSQSVHHPTPPLQPPDPVLQILITSNIKSTQPLIVSRRLSQRLKDVRLAWVERQHFTPEFVDRVFLTWRGKRLFDVTSCRSLGIAVDSAGNVTFKGEGFGEEERQIHMEAMTAEILDAYKKAKQRVTAVEEEAPAQEEVVEEQKHEAQVKIILKAKGFQDFKLIVKPVRTCVL